MEKVIIVTDCTGIKQDAIKGVFDANFENIEIIVSKEKKFETPLTKDGFFKVIAERMIELSLNEANYFVSGQKGYFKMGDLWHFQGIFSVRKVGKEMVPAFTTSVPIPKKVSDEKTKDLSRNFGDILAEKYPRWDKEKDSVFTLLTGESEKDWLQVPLRYCMKYLLHW